MIHKRKMSYTLQAKILPITKVKKFDGFKILPEEFDKYYEIIKNFDIREREAIIISPQPKPKDYVDFIHITVLNHFYVDKNYPRNSSREKFRGSPLVVRQILAYFLTEMSKQTLLETGKLLGNYDHATILYNHRKVANMIETKDPLYIDDCETILNIIFKNNEDTDKRKNVG